MLAVSASVPPASPAIDIVQALRRTLDPPVELHETHGSWVLVGGDRALKVKKPVVMPFLDYATLERHREACAAEVEVNRRLAPDVYLGVAAIVPAPCGVELAPAGDPRAVEYAVRMRRYAEADTLAARVARGAATPGDLERVGVRLARFHAEAEPAGDGAGAEPVKRWLDDTHASLRDLLPSWPERALVARSERFAAAFLTAHWDELDARARAGRVRDGHGDLRAEHVVLEGGAILVVDGIEFDPALRRIDVGCDLAFLTMDLEAAGRGDLARRLVVAYRDAGGDPGEDELLSWLAGYRALVRAKVALLRAGQQADGEREASRAKASRLLRLAERLEWRARGPVTIAVAGLAASGKSTLAVALAERSGLPQFSADVVRKQQAGLAPTARAAATDYAPERNAAVYSELGRRAAAAPEGAIVDATFRAAVARDGFRRAHGSGRDVVHVECVAPLAVRLGRAREREADTARVSDAGAAVAARQLMEPMDEVPAARHVTVRGDDALPAQLGAVADALDRVLLASG